MIYWCNIHFIATFQLELIIVHEINVPVLYLMDSVPSTEKNHLSSLLCFDRSVMNCGKGNDNPIQYLCLENSWWATVHGVTKSWTRLMD